MALTLSWEQEPQGSLSQMEIKQELQVQIRDHSLLENKYSPSPNRELKKRDLSRECLWIEISGSKRWFLSGSLWARLFPTFPRHMDANLGPVHHQQKPAPTPTAVLQPGGERRMEETDPKTIEDPKVMIHRLFTPRCRLGD